MVKHIYMTLAALVFLAIAVNAAPAKMEYDMVKDSDLPGSRKTAADENSSAASDENDDDDEDEVEKKQNDSDADDDDEEDDDDDDDLSFIRRRREAVEEPAKEPTEVKAPAAETPAPAEESVEGVTTIPTTTRKPVLVLIRDALKKVTTGLPTQQVANNALQYFQLFEHFIQQTIEQVIEATDDDEDETPAPTVEEDKKPTETAETQPEKQTEDASASSSVPVTVPEENKVKPTEPEAASNAV